MSDNYLPTDYQSFIHKSRYARWLEAEGRRESWGETVTRYMDNLVKPALGDYPKQIAEIEEAISKPRSLPSV